MNKKLVFFFMEDRKREGYGVSRSLEGRIILPTKGVGRGELWLCEVIKTEPRFEIVTPIEKISASAGILVSADAEKENLEDPHLLEAALLDLLVPRGDRWWKAELANELNDSGIFRVIKNSSKVLKANDEEVTFKQKVTVGFFIEIGGVRVEKADIIGTPISEFANRFTSYCNGLRGWWEVLTAFGQSREKRIWVNTHMHSDLATFALSRAAGGPGWVTGEAPLVRKVLELLTSSSRQKE